MRWNDEQLTAINATGKNITVSASAGAGKTAVLVERLVKRIIEDGVSIDTIVALTFTEAAAAEMKNRLTIALNQKLSEQPDNSYLKSQIALVADAQITTIHSFCLTLLKNHYYMLDMTPEALNNILDDAAIAKIQERAFDETFESYPQQELFNLQKVLSSSAYNFDKLKDIVANLTTEALTKTNPHQWLDKSLLIYDDFESIQQLPNCFKDPFLTILNSFVLQLKQASLSTMRLIDNLKNDHNIEKQNNWIQEVYQLIPNLKTALQDFDYHFYRETVINIAEIPNPALRGVDEYKVQRDRVRDLLNDMVTFLYPEEILLHDLALLKPEMTTLIEFTKQYLERYQTYIKAEQGITFNDMETLAYKLLTINDQEVAKQLREEYVDILVDEFQDTNILQNEIITLISKGNNVFRVGDVKQSIYKFRGAKPTIMQKLIDLGETENHMTINLKHNYRSKQAIVEYNNHLFNQLMNLDLFSGSYSENDHVSVGVEAQSEDSVPVELHLVNSDKEAYEFDENQSNNELKANYIAYQISKMKQENPESNWNDYVVLVQSNKQKEYMRDAFDAVNIPSFISMPDGFYQSSGVSTTLAYLRVIADYHDDISLMAVLTNLYGYTEDEITQHFLKTQSLKDVADCLDPAINKKIEYYRYQQNKIPLSEIIDDIFAINNYYETKINKQERTNLDLFYETALNYQSRYNGIHGFINTIDAMKDEKTSEAIALTGEDDVVNVMTFHNSKGLQFDTVFIWSKSLRRSPSASKGYLIDSDLGLAHKSVLLPQRIVRDNVAHYVITYKEEIEEYEEEMRTLYVATTRAQRRMIIVDLYNFEKDQRYNNFNYTHVLDNIGFTGWIKAVHDTNHSKYLKVKEIMEFEPIINPEPISKPSKILKFETQPSSMKAKQTHFPLTPLNLKHEVDGTDVGTAVHQTVEKLAETDWSLTTIQDIAPQLSSYYQQRIYNLGQNQFMQQLLKMDAYFERAFIIKDHLEINRGIIDFLAIDTEHCVIVDFKTDRLDNEKDFIERYQEQLQFYIAAMQEQYPNKEISAYIYSFRLETFILIF